VAGLFGWHVNVPSDFATFVKPLLQVRQLEGEPKQVAQVEVHISFPITPPEPVGEQVAKPGGHGRQTC